ncbi:MAG: ketol-acid reductoisomerase [Planctomycetota bacterium]|jgi:ketol-acid reductoisomerase
MALTIYRAEDADLNGILNTPVSVIGYGNQGRAHALNLRDSGVDVRIGQRPGGSFDRAVADGFAPLSAGDATDAADLVIVTLPDESAAEIYEAEIRAGLRPGNTLGFVHGFNIRYGLIKPSPEIDVVMIAPKGPGTLLRSLYEQQKGLPSLVAIGQDASGHALRTALAWAAGIGSDRAAIVETTFAAETETDLFGEQVVLCGGVTALMKAAFETLVDAGYEPEFAYLECIHELKQVVDLVYEHGISVMRDRVSNTAEYGDLTRGPRIVTDETRAAMKQILEEIRNGSFADEWIKEHRSGERQFQDLFERDLRAPFEDAGDTVRSLMPWLAATKDPEK